MKAQLCTLSVDPPKQLCNLFMDFQITFKYPELPALSLKDNMPLIQTVRRLD